MRTETARVVPQVVNAAKTIAVQAHTGQKDKAGEPYLTHPARVAYAVRQAGGGPEAEAAAWLHDVLEDSNFTAAMLIMLGIPDTVVEAVEALTGRPGESYAEKLARAAANPIALLVKRADVADNGDPERLARLAPDTAKRLREKYAKAAETLASRA